MQIEVEMSRMRLGERQDISPLKIVARVESGVDYLRHHFRDLVEAVLDLIEGGVDVRVQQLHCRPEHALESEICREIRPRLWVAENEILIGAQRDNFEYDGLGLARREHAEAVERQCEVVDAHLVQLGALRQEALVPVREREET